MKISNISVIILTKNEESNIRDCLTRVNQAGEVIVFDSGSTDKTCTIAKELGSRVIQHPFINFSDQRNAAMQSALRPWIFFVDADERVTPQLWSEIEKLPETLNVIYSANRANYFFNKRLRFSGSQNDFQTRLMPASGPSWVQPVHERLETSLPTKKLAQLLIHITTRDQNHYEEKMQRYIPLEIENMRERGQQCGRMTPYWRAIAKFFYLYLFKFGFADGAVGFKYSILSARYDYVKFTMLRKQLVVSE